MTFEVFFGFAVRFFFLRDLVRPKDRERTVDAWEVEVGREFPGDLAVVVGGAAVLRLSLSVDFICRLFLRYGVARAVILVFGSPEEACFAIVENIVQ